MSDDNLGADTSPTRRVVIDRVPVRTLDRSSHAETMASTAGTTLDSIDAHSLLSLPAELIQHVLSFLGPLDLTRTTQTCRQLAHASYDDQLWQTLVNDNLPEPIADPAPCKTFHNLYVAHHPHWFLPRNVLWFADSEPSGKLLVSKYDPTRGCIEAFAVAAYRGPPTIQFWEKDSEVIIHGFNPRVTLDRSHPVLKLDADSPRTDEHPYSYPSDRGYALPSPYSKETLMETFAEAGLYGSFMLCRKMPQAVISNQTRVWPPLRLPSASRVRNDSGDGYKSVGHRPTQFSEVSQDTFRLRKWVEYTGRRSSTLMRMASRISAPIALGINVPYFNPGTNEQGGTSIRLPEDITTYATLPKSAYTPTPDKPYQGLWCGDYSGHGVEFLVIIQPDKGDERPLPSGMDWLRGWFQGGNRRSSGSSESSYASALEEIDPGSRANGQAVSLLDTSSTEAVYDGGARPETDVANPPTGRLEAIKLTGDPNIPRGEYTFIAPDIGHDGFMRVADEEMFRGARVVRSAGHIAGRGFREDQYTLSQLILISHDRVAQFWEGFGHISYYQRVDMEALMRA